LPSPTATTTHDYGELKRRVKAQGLLEPQTGYYVMKTAVALLTLAAVVTVALVASHPAVILLDAVLFGFASTQIALLGHDVGHRQAFRGRRANAVARYVFGNVLLGISHSWWNVKHNQHHATPNHVDKDPDIQFPIIVFSDRQIAERASWLRPLIAMQAFVFPLLLPFQAPNMRINSIGHLITGSARKPILQGLFMAIHFALYGALLYALGGWGIALAFVAIHQVTFGLYNSSIFATNHKGMPLTAEGERLDFLREQVLTSRNVHGHRLTDFWYGGLNYQIEHHLFPTMPRKNLSRAQAAVRAFCDEHAIAYCATGLFQSYREGFRHLHQVSASLRTRTGAASS
jgi:fatty acid desaturase